jgi:hypothetical protein
MIISTSEKIRFRARSLYIGLFDTTTLRHRHFDGLIASKQHSGRHWLKYMLGLTLAKLYDLPPPAHIHDESIVGKRKSLPLFPQIPQIISDQSLSHYLLRSRAVFRLLRFPRYLIMTRDIRDALAAHYENKHSRYNVDFSTYLRGDVGGKRYKDDIWRRIRFLNGWGAVVKRHPEQFAILKYEDLLADTHGQFARVCDHFRIKGITTDLLDEVVATASKENMRRLPILKGKSIVIRARARPYRELYSEDDRRFVAEACRRNLKYTFGYRY